MRTYTGETIQTLGRIEVEVSINNQTEHLSLEVVQGSGPRLLGIDWLEKLKLDWTQVHQLRTNDQLQTVLDCHKEVFEDQLGCIEGVKAKLHLKSDVQPKFLRARNLPFALREKVERELKRLVEAGVITPVQHAEWATPIFPVMKQNGTVRICGDYKTTNNQPLPRIDDLLSSLAGGKAFTKMDLAHTYMQVPLEDESKSLTTINTHKGLYQYNRLPFGISSAPAIFQRTMEKILRDIPQVFVYIDDILLTGGTEREHLQNLDVVLKRLKEKGIRLKQEKCYFMLQEVEYLGHVLSSRGIQPSPKNVRAIQSVPAPENITQLKSFLGMVTYYLKLNFK